MLQHSIPEETMNIQTERHYAVIDNYDRKLTLTFNNEIVVESTSALILKEVGKSVYNPVLYFPKSDVKLELELEEDRTSYCPIKGDATYWKLKDSNPEEYFAWSYEDALPKTKKIKAYIAFNTSQMTVISEPLS